MLTAQTTRSSFMLSMWISHSLACETTDIVWLPSSMGFNAPLRMLRGVARSEGVFRAAPTAAKAAAALQPQPVLRRRAPDAPAALRLVPASPPRAL